MKGGNMSKKIMLDPGHYEGYNRFNGGSEGTNNWEVCMDLKKELERFGLQVGITKNSVGANPSLEARGRAGQGYDLLLSIHSNAGGGSGVEVFDDTNPKYSNKKLADAICKAIATSLNLPNRGVKYRKNNSGSNYYGVLRNQYAKSGMIVELFFHDNQKDLDAFKANKIRPTMAGLGDSKNPGKDCSLMLGITNPYSHELTNYLGYDLTKLKDSVRFLEVVLNREGQSNGIIALYFDGKTCTFRELPPPNDREALEKVYKYLESIRGKSNKVFMWFNKLIKKN